MVKLIYLERLPTAGRLLVHWGLGIALGGMIEDTLAAMTFGIIICTIGHFIVQLWGPVYSKSKG